MSKISVTIDYVKLAQYILAVEMLIKKLDRENALKYTKKIKDILDRAALDG